LALIIVCMTPSGTTTSNKVQTCEWISTSLTAKLEEYNACKNKQTPYVSSCGVSPLYPDIKPETLAGLLVGPGVSIMDAMMTYPREPPAEWIECYDAWYDRNAPPQNSQDGGEREPGRVCGTVGLLAAGRQGNGTGYQSQNGTSSR
jgi:hypothetical protein